MSLHAEPKDMRDVASSGGFPTANVLARNGSYEEMYQSLARWQGQRVRSV